MLQYVIAEQTFLNIYIPNQPQQTLVTSHQHNTKLYLSLVFFLTPKYPIIDLDQLKYRLGLVNISLDWLISVWIS